MKPIVAKQYPYTADYYNYTLITSADGLVTEKRYATIPTQVKLSLSVNLLGELVIDSETKMQLEGQLKNIVDRNGEEIYDAGQETLLNDLKVDCNAEIEVYIAGDDVETTAEGYVRFDSSHPEAIEIILAEAEESFEEFLSRLSTTSTEAYQGLDLIETIRQIYVDEAFKDLGS